RPHTSFSRDWSSDVCSSDLRAPRREVSYCLDHGKQGGQESPSVEQESRHPFTFEWWMVGADDGANASRRTAGRACDLRIVRELYRALSIVSQSAWGCDVRARQYSDGAEAPLCGCERSVSG